MSTKRIQNSKRRWRSGQASRGLRVVNQSVEPSSWCFFRPPGVLFYSSSAIRLALLASSPPMEVKNTTRRAVLAGIAAAPALAAPVLAHPAGDSRLRELWAQYLKDLAGELAARAALDPARAAYDAEEPPCPDDMSPGHHFEACRPLWKKHGLDRLYDAWNDAGERTDATIKAILEQEAEGLFGVGAKLAALPTQEDQDPAY